MPLFFLGGALVTFKNSQGDPQHINNFSSRLYKAPYI